MTAFDIDRRLDETLEDLRRHYGAASKAQVLGKAVALMKLASQHEHQDGAIVLRKRQGGYLRLLLADGPKTPGASSAPGPLGTP